MIGVLDPASLEANRSGRLTETQRATWAGTSATWRGQMRSGALALVAIAALVLVGASSTVALPVRLLTAVGLVGAAAALLVLGRVSDRGLASDVKAGRVVAVEGALDRYRESTAARELYQGSSHARPDHYELLVNGRRYTCGRDAYQAAADPGHVRLFVLPRSGWVVNIERLPDRPSSAGPEATGGVLVAAREALRGSDQSRAEAMASLAAMERAVTGDAITGFDADGRALRPGTMPGAAAPLSPAEIVGTWQNPLLRATFAADGTAAAVLATGMTLSGAWSVDAQGRLSVSGMGGSETAEASLAGDALTLSLDGQRLQLRRVPPAAAAARQPG